MSGDNKQADKPGSSKIFNLDAFRTTSGHGTRTRSRRGQWQRQFIMVPWGWVERLGTRRVGDCTYRLAFLVLYEHWRNGSQPIVLSNILAAEVGLSRQDKWRALHELECLRLVRVIRRRGASPQVILRDMKGYQT
jgi:hypothetical protein